MIDNTSHLYQQVLLDHNKTPRNFKELNPADHDALGYNPLCGDKYKVFINIDENDVVTDVTFTGEGCAISKASASMMTTIVKGKHIDEIEKLYRQFHDMTQGKMDPEKEPNDLGRLKVFAGVRNLPARVKCATLSWHTLNAALKGEEKVTTE
ncbi:Fe-S cluster assembly sulfur transfer protein SufU [Natronogracilivirga saccharolytica]|uniref:SUF system NifU family Fe-S cluster assembly protein n=1 Tax=Natronogracilivirga saccharolytica TaxID=2812953 RepID=A0A8J7RLS7_9BACT|nr:SUF system NifU family Fe-S cluster assembly protein [Natronogracilivirga saccharolytica]MBP3193702.1 SUF system NifU family Fe-S cluster assembly protein [Natronogracilivirga saccharolytica]